jgi:hypothetical protein
VFHLSRLAPRYVGPSVVGWALLLALLSVPVSSSGQPAEEADQPAPTTWTSNKGLAVEAEFVRMTDEAVVLKMKRDGKEATVPLASLSIESIYQAVRLANPEAFSKPVPKAEVKPEITIELPQLNLDVNELLKSPFASNTDIQRFLQILERAPQEGNFLVAWHALPPKMQADIEELIVKGYQVLGPTTVKQIQMLLHDLDKVLRDKQQFIKGLPQIQANPLVAEQIDQNLPLLASFVAGLAKDEHWQSSNFQTGSVPRWLANLNVDLAPAVLAAIEALKANLPEGIASTIGNPSFNIVSQKADSAEVEVSLPGRPPQKSTFQKVGNIWINVPQMNQLRVNLDAAKEKLASGATQEVGLLRTSLGGIIAVVGGLARANTQAEFEEAVNQLQAIGEGLNQSLGLQSAGNSPPGSRAGR